MISFGNSTGALFVRLGKIAAVMKNLRSYQTTQQTAMIDPNTGIVAQFNAEPDIQSIIGSNYLGILSATGANVGSTLQSLASSIINRAVYRDNPQPGQTLTNANIVTSLREVVRQMKLAGATVLAQTVTAATSPFAGTGNGVVVASVRRPLDGLILENAFAETLFLSVTADSYSGNVPAGNERLSVSGEGSIADVFAFNWPLGSGAGIQVSAIDGNTDNGNGNLLTNSGFEKWSGGIPANWVFVTGAGLVSRETGLVFGGTSALKITGDGVTKVNFSQQFAKSTGTLGTLTPQIQYGFNFFMRRDGVAGAAGTLVIDLVDQNGMAILDAGGNNINSLTVDLSSTGPLTTNYAAFNVAFRTPVIMPASIFLRFRTTIAQSNLRAIYIDKVSFGLMNQTYRGGPFLSAHSGSVPFVFGDNATVSINNSRGSGGTLDTFQTATPRLIPTMGTNEILWPSSSSPSLSDTLIG